ncbi:unnamed protein product [Ceratitis capitata]|uniref:(Mediterranean fruit fly) hypothetical protein n=1 Tax=Ceratitis capitata TaxID=7213 RepID=A0A811VGP5_CERCA|nr:unnamed protein product [Ceratitis capitata]
MLGLYVWSIHLIGGAYNGRTCLVGVNVEQTAIQNLARKPSYTESALLIKNI